MTACVPVSIFELRHVAYARFTLCTGLLGGFVTRFVPTLGPPVPVKEDKRSNRVRGSFNSPAQNELIVCTITKMVVMTQKACNSWPMVHEFVETMIFVILKRYKNCIYAINVAGNFVDLVCL